VKLRVHNTFRCTKYVDCSISFTYVVFSVESKTTTWRPREIYLSLWYR